MTQFACVFSDLIHDVDQAGVPNTRLLEESPAFAEKYRNRSVAEQNSLELSWDLLMNDKAGRYQNLRSLLFTTQAELQRFRELVVNSVMATDICDKELKELRNARWEKAFRTTITTATGASNDSPRDQINRKATIVIEHLIQASDVSHTMQHW